MAQERFAAAEYFNEFDPEKFIRDLKRKNDVAPEKDSVDKESTQEDKATDDEDGNTRDASGD